MVILHLVQVLDLDWDYWVQLESKEIIGKSWEKSEREAHIGKYHQWTKSQEIPAHSDPQDHWRHKTII